MTTESPSSDKKRHFTFRAPDAGANQEPPLKPIRTYKENGYTVTVYPPRPAHGILSCFDIYGFETDSE